MSSTTLISVRIPDGLAQRLVKLADAMDHSKSYLVEQALEEFIALQGWKVSAIRQGVRQADAGKLVVHKQALKVLSGWGRRRG